MAQLSPIKEKKVKIDFEPFKPVNTYLYLCDNNFHTEALSTLLADDNKFEFIVMDGNGALFGTLWGNTRCDVLHKLTVSVSIVLLSFSECLFRKTEVLNLGMDFIWTGEKVNAGQGGIYVRLNYPFKTDVQVSIS